MGRSKADMSEVSTLGMFLRQAYRSNAPATEKLEYLDGFDEYFVKNEAKYIVNPELDPADAQDWVVETIETKFDFTPKHTNVLLVHYDADTQRPKGPTTLQSLLRHLIPQGALSQVYDTVIADENVSALLRVKTSDLGVSHEQHVVYSEEDAKKVTPLVKEVLTKNGYEYRNKQVTFIPTDEPETFIEQETAYDPTNTTLFDLISNEFRLEYGHALAMATQLRKYHVAEKITIPNVTGVTKSEVGDKKIVTGLQVTRTPELMNYVKKAYMELLDEKGNFDRRKLARRFNSRKPVPIDEKTLEDRVLLD